jgi:membrane fusion protein, multidrug efflux system
MKKIIPLVVLLAAGLFVYLNSQPQPTQTSRPRPVPNVVVAKAAIQTVRDEVEALGTVKAFESVTITSKVTDVVTNLNFNDGDVVTKGSLLVQLQDAEQAAKVKVAKVKVAEHRRELDRISELVSNRTVAELERDRLQTLYDTARAELEQAQAALQDRRISAPFGGRLGLRQLSVGTLATPGTTMTTLDDISTIKLDFSVPERFLLELAPGKSVEASAVAYPDKLFSGKVSSIDSRVNPTTRAVTVRAELANPEMQLLPGMLMKVRLIKEQRQALLLPESALVPIQAQHFVYLVNGENRVERKQVTLGLRTRGWVEIISGVEPDEQVIIRGLLKVRPGDEVKTQLSENFSFNSALDAETSV